MGACFAMTLVLPDVDEISDIPQAPGVRHLPGYHIVCRACGLVYAASRRLAVLDYGCSAASLLGPRASLSARVMRRSSEQAIFGDYLARINADPARQHCHWPAPSPPMPHEHGYLWFQCAKCGQRASNAGKASLIQGVCSRRAQRLHQALPVLNQEPANLLIEARDLRGGLQLNFGTLNVGSLSQKEHGLPSLGCDIVSLQEVAVPASRWKSVAKTSEGLWRHYSLGIPYDHEDHRPRGRGWGIRLGTGLAVVAFQPWLVHNLEGSWPLDATSPACSAQTSFYSCY